MLRVVVVEKLVGEVETMKKYKKIELIFGLERK